MTNIGAAGIWPHGEYASRVTERIVVTIFEEQTVSLADILVNPQVKLVVALSAGWVEDKVVGGCGGSGHWEKGDDLSSGWV